MVEDFLNSVYEFSNQTFVALLVVNAVPFIVLAVVLCIAMCLKNKEWAGNIFYNISRLINSMTGGKLDDTVADRVHNKALESSGQPWRGKFWATLSNWANWISWFE